MPRASRRRRTTRPRTGAEEDDATARSAPDASPSDATASLEGEPASGETSALACSSNFELRRFSSVFTNSRTRAHPDHRASRRRAAAAMLGSRGSASDERARRARARPCQHRRSRRRLLARGRPRGFRNRGRIRAVRASLAPAKEQDALAWGERRGSSRVPSGCLEHLRARAARRVRKRTLRARAGGRADTHPLVEFERTCGTSASSAVVTPALRFLSLALATSARNDASAQGANAARSPLASAPITLTAGARDGLVRVG